MSPTENDFLLQSETSAIPLEGKADIRDNGQIAHLLRHIEQHNPRVILEYGAGASTLAMAQATDAQIVSVETWPAWYDQLKLKLAPCPHVRLLLANMLSRTGEAWSVFPEYLVVKHQTAEPVPATPDMIYIDGPAGKVISADVLYLALKPSTVVFIDKRVPTFVYLLTHGHFTATFHPQAQLFELRPQ